MIIKKAKKEQAEEIVELLKYICGIHKKGRPDIFVSGQPKYDTEDVCRLIDDENYHIISAEEDGRVVGYMIAELVDGSKHSHMRSVKTLYIDDICVDEAYAHKGVIPSAVICWRRRVYRSLSSLNASSSAKESSPA